MYVVTRAQMRKIEGDVMLSGRLSGFDLMQNAAAGVLNQIMEHFDSDVRTKQIVVFCGSGNNGGDGYVIAYMLWERGAKITVVSVSDPAGLSGDAKRAYELYCLTGMGTYTVSEIDNKFPKNCVCIVDAVFGTGLNKPLAGDHLRAVEIINSSPAYTVAVDLPSGINADSGQIMGGCVRADLTVTFAFKKPCHVTYPCINMMGRLVICDIGIKRSDVDAASIRIYETDDKLVDKIIPARKKNTNKGDYGRLIMIAGSKGMAGAAMLAARAAARSGAGLVTAAIPESIYPILASNVPEAVTMPLSQSESGSISKAASDKLIERFKTQTAALIGCGMGNSEDTRELVRTAVRNSGVPVIIDADGLNALSGDLSILQNKSSEIILTPHPKEFSRLTGLSVEEVEADRIKNALEFAKKYGVTVVLKGARTVVASSDGVVYVNSTGNPGMATAGSGDVLAGIIASFCAQGIKPLAAAVAGVFIHGRAGDIAASLLGEYALIASDIIGNLPRALIKYDK
ncbi:MAG: NAD(P)H-hydrate dehydratase [Clostridia bacterium]|nr:NAD(P)H-hydrate dehydratase [Clostridia bacterium]